MLEKDKLKTFDEIKDGIYFRFTPYKYDWLVLLGASVLISVNKIYTNPDSKDLEDQVYRYLKEKYPKGVNMFEKGSVKTRSFIIYCLLFLMLYFIGRAQTNIINITFFTLNVLNAMILAKNDNKNKTLRWAMRISKVITYLSITVIVIEVWFAITIGSRPSKFPQSND